MKKSTLFFVPPRNGVSVSRRIKSFDWCFPSSLVQSLSRSLPFAVFLWGIRGRIRKVRCVHTKPDEDDDNDNTKGNNEEKKAEDESGKKSGYSVVQSNPRIHIVKERMRMAFVGAYICIVGA